MRIGLYVFFILIAHLALADDVAIKATTNRDDIHIGDYWLTQDLADGFRRINHDATVDYRGEYQTVHQPEPKMNLYMRGYTKFYAPFPSGTNVLYCYYPMTYNEKSALKVDKNILNKRPEMPLDASLDDDWQNFDILLVASPSYAKKLQEKGVNAIYVPQFTNPHRFYPNPEEKLMTNILFVGSNWHDRTSLRYAIQSGFNVDVYGYNWKGVIPDEMYKGDYIENKDLNRYYSSAKIVLNDHRPDMKEFGFINNRIYDASASGALVISDYMPEIEAVYGDSVPMYKTKEELVELITYYLTHEEKRQEKANKAREITLKNFTNEIVAQKIWSYVP